MTVDHAREELRDVVRAFAVKYSADGRVREDLSGESLDSWSQLAVHMGLAGIAVEEQFGGAEGSLMDVVVAIEELGRLLIPSPLFAAVALAVPVLQEFGDASANERWLGAISVGELKATVAHHTGDVTAAESTDGWRLNGTVDHVISASTADLLLVRARTNEGHQLFGVAAAHDSARLDHLPVLDFTRPMATVNLRDAPGQLVENVATDAAFERALTTATIVLAAEQVGGAQGCLDRAVEHAKTRTQFGRPIGAFQSIKHICADLFTEVACARTLTYDAARAGDDDRALSAAMASVVAAEAFVHAAEQSIQVHGALGYTWDSDCHLYLRRARSSSQLLAPPRSHHEMIAEELIGSTR
ncbi:MAG: acyl-CoA dehydrogenase family protein [Acidimicrobiales bacterium]